MWSVSVSIKLLGIRLAISSSAFQKLKKARERANRRRDAKTVADEQEPPVAKFRKRLSVSEECMEWLCRKEGEGNDRLPCFSTLESDRNVRQMALELGDFELLGRMSEGDFIAIE